MHRLPDLPVGVRALTNEQSAWLDQRYPDLPRATGPNNVPNCITCRGRKTFRWYAIDPLDGRIGEVVDYDCPCGQQYVLHRVLLHSGIEESYQRLGWEDFLYLPEDAADKAGEYLTNPAYVESGFGMIVHGDRGNGKTLLGNLMLKKFIGDGKDVYATRFSQMIDLFAGGWTSKDERDWFNRRVRNAGVLLVDDLGRERNKGSGTVGDAMLEEVIRGRVARSKPTIITTNLTLEQITSGYGGHTMSLLYERSTTCEFRGEDRRAEMRLRLVNEIAAGLTRPVVLA